MKKLKIEQKRIEFEHEQKIKVVEEDKKRPAGESMSDEQ